MNLRQPRGRRTRGLAAMGAASVVLVSAVTIAALHGGRLPPSNDAGSFGRGRTPTSTPGDPALASTAPDGTVTFGEIGAVVSPATRGARPAVSRPEALAVLETSQRNAALSGEPKTPDSLELRMYRNAFGGTRTDGSMIPSVPEQLVWYAVYKNVPSNPIAGPANIHPSSVVPAPGTSCNLYVAVSATTPDILDSYRICGPDLPG